MPNRSRIGEVKSPARVVAPMSVNGFSSIGTLRADAVTYDHIKAAIHRGIQIFFDDGIKTVNFVDKVSRALPGLSKYQPGRLCAQRRFTGRASARQVHRRCGRGWFCPNRVDH